MRRHGTSKVRYLFEGYALDTDRRELRVGTDLVPVEPQVFDLLAYLIQNRDHVVSKDDLLASIWQGRIVSESALTTRINAARTAIGDSGEQQRLIKTFVRKGIRFVGTVREEQPQLPAAVAEQQTQALVLPDRPSIAVLPFTNMSGDAEQEYIADGIVEDIITELSRFSELFVIARNSSFHYKGMLPDVRQIGRELGVRYVLEGSIRRDRDRLRISAQLVDALSGTHRWAERYDRGLGDVFAVQDELARSVAANLAAQVSKAEAERTLLKPPATWQAYDYYMRAADAYAAFHRPMRVEAIYETRHFLEQCLAIDPNFARAYVLLSATLSSAWILPLDGDHLNPAVLEAAYLAAVKAVQLDSNLPQAHAQLGFVLGFKRQREAAVAEFERALAINPNFTDWRFAAVLVYAGQAERAIDVAKAHLRVDPFTLPVARGFLGLAYFMLKRYPEAVATIREFVAQAPNHRPGRMWFTASYAQMGKFEEAREQAAELVRIDPLWTSSGRFRKATAHFRTEDAEHLAEGLRKAGLQET